jgi:hypothetical protein
MGKITARCVDLGGLAWLAATIVGSSALWADEPTPAAPAVCFGRVYDAAHMKTHPDQKIQRIFLFHGPDPVSRPSEEPPSSPSPDSSFLATTVRGADKPKWTGTSCDPMGPVDGKDGKMRCGRACDRTLGYLQRGKNGEVTLTGIPAELYLDPDAEETLGKAEYERQSFGKDDDNFRLDPQPVETCKAEFARIDPPNLTLGPPLRERLKVDQPFCYGRDYDAEHVKSHVAQLTTAIRVFRGPTQMANYSKIYTPDRWPDNAEVLVSVTNRHDGKTVTQTVACQGEGDQWSCLPSNCDTNYRKIYLRRDFHGGMALVNPDAALAIVGACPAEGVTVTKSDDKIFRLSPMPLDKCGL